jgi:hypothetical protein
MFTVYLTSVDGGRWSSAFAQRMAIAANRVLAA